VPHIILFALITQLLHTDFNAGVGLVRMMGKTNYVGLVGGGKQPKFAANKAGRLTVFPEVNDIC
jgi:hypothetical protein